MPGYTAPHLGECPHKEAVYSPLGCLFARIIGRLIEINAQERIADPVSIQCGSVLSPVRYRRSVISSEPF